MPDHSFTLQERALTQQGFDYGPEELRELSWALRFTPTVCMAAALAGLVTRQPLVHFALAALGIIPFWLPSKNPLDLFYNAAIRPLWGGVRLPPNPLPRRIACLMGGAMNILIGVSFTAGKPGLAYGFGAVLVALQLVVITSHFCVASWMYEVLLRALGRWTAPVDPGKAKGLVSGGARLIDVRSPEEFAASHLPGAENVPLEKVVSALTGKENGALVLYCRSGLRSQRAVQLLKKAQFRDLHNLGALSRWPDDAA